MCISQDQGSSVEPCIELVVMSPGLSSKRANRQGGR